MIYKAYNFLNFVLIGFVNFKHDTLNIVLWNLKIVHFNGLERENPSSYESLTVFRSLKNIDAHINKMNTISYKWNVLNSFNVMNA